MHDEQNPTGNSEPMKRYALSALFACLASSLAIDAAGSVPSVAECLEASDFIANAARSRDNGLTRDTFMERLEGDLAAIRNYPAPLRWFAHDDADARFLAESAGQVFDTPADPEVQRAQFLRSCFARAEEAGGAGV